VTPAAGSEPAQSRWEQQPKFRSSVEHETTTASIEWWPANRRCLACSPRFVMLVLRIAAIPQPASHNGGRSALYKLTGRLICFMEILQFTFPHPTRCPRPVLAQPWLKQSSLLLRIKLLNPGMLEFGLLSCCKTKTGETHSGEGVRERASAYFWSNHT